MKKYNVIVEGILTPEFTEEEVISKLIVLLKIPEAQAHTLIQRRGFKLKKNITEEQGLRYLNALKVTGLNVKLSPVLHESDSPTTVTPSEPSYATNFEELSLASPYADDEHKEKQSISNKQSSDNEEKLISSVPASLALHKSREYKNSTIGKNPQDSLDSQGSFQHYHPNQDDTPIEDIYVDDFDDKPSIFNSVDDGRHGPLDYVNGIVIVFGLYIGFLIFSKVMPPLLTKILFVAPISFLTFRIVKFRAQDAGTSGSIPGFIVAALAALSLWSANIIIFILNLLVLLGIFLMPSQKEKNEYGDIPKEPKNWGKIAIIPIIIIMCLLTYQNYRKYKISMDRYKEMMEDLRITEKMTTEERQEYYQKKLERH